MLSGAWFYKILPPWPPRMSISSLPQSRVRTIQPFCRGPSLCRSSSGRPFPPTVRPLYFARGFVSQPVDPNLSIFPNLRYFLHLFFYSILTCMYSFGLPIGSGLSVNRSTFWQLEIWDNLVLGGSVQVGSRGVVFDDRKGPRGGCKPGSLSLSAGDIRFCQSPIGHPLCLMLNLTKKQRTRFYF